MTEDEIDDVIQQAQFALSPPYLEVDIMKTKRPLSPSRLLLIGVGTALVAVGGPLTIRTLFVPLPSSLTIESSIEIPSRPEVGIPLDALARCQRYGPVRSVARPEVLARHGETGVVGSVLYSLRGGSLPGDPCGVYEADYTYDIASLSWTLSASHPQLDLGATAACRWKDTRATDGSEDHVFVSSSMVEGPTNSCSPGADRFRLLSLVEDDAGLETARSASLNPADSVGACASTPQLPILWFTDDAAVATIGAYDYAVTACGNPGIAGSPRTFRFYRVAIDGAVTTFSVDASPGSATGLAIPRWPDLGQVGLAAVGGGSQALLVYVGDSLDGSGPRLAWGLLDVDPATCPAGCIVDRGGWLGGIRLDAERYPLGVTVKGDKVAVAFLHVDDDSVWRSCSDGDHQCLPSDAGGLVVRVYALGGLGDLPIAEIEIEDYDRPSAVSSALLTAPSHPDLAWVDNRLVLAYALDHYPETGCGLAGDQPCRWRAANPRPGEDDIKLITSKLMVIKTAGL